MKTKKELSPKIYKTSSGKYQIHIWYKNKRFRFANGRVIEDVQLKKPSSIPYAMAQVSL